MTIIDILAFGVLATFIALGILDVFLMVAQREIERREDGIDNDSTACDSSGADSER